MYTNLRLVACCLVLLAVAPQKGVAHDETGDDEAVAHNLLNALTDFIGAHSDEVSEELQNELAHVQSQLEAQKNTSEQLEHQIHVVAQEAMVSPECDGVIAGSVCYVLHNQKLSFDMATTECLQKGSELANIDNEYHYNQVMDYILQHNVFTDRSAVFAWTGLPLENDDAHYFRWLPSYPRETTSYNRIAWQLVSSNNYGDHGYLNVPDVATAYPLCQHEVDIGIDDCSPDPCQNNGNCTDGVNAYTCSCPAPFTGVDCENTVLGSGCSDDTDCATVTHAVCTSEEGASSGCTCDVGFEVNNETLPTACNNIDDCSPNPCQNNGTCTDGVNSYNCSCVGGYTGVNCEDAPIERCEKPTSTARRRRRSATSNLNYVGFIVDDTGSMASEIAVVRQWLSACVSSGTNCGSAPSGGWLLQSYNDPTIGTPVGPTTDASAIDAAIGNLVANGGGDCPERAFAGMLSALERIPEDNANCKFFFFTDASDSNPELAREVMTQMEAKGCSLIAVLTGCCGTCRPVTPGTVYAPGDPLEFLYYETAATSGGEVYILPKPSSATEYTSALESTITTLGYCPTDIIVANADGSCKSEEQCEAEGHCFDSSLKVCFQN